MKTLAGPGSEVQFTHLSQSSCDTLTALFAQSPAPEAEARAEAHPEGVLEFMKRMGVPLDKVCLLDPKAEKELSPEDGDGRFEWFLFGVSSPVKRYARLSPDFSSRTRVFSVGCTCFYE